MKEEEQGLLKTGNLEDVDADKFEDGDGENNKDQANDGGDDGLFALVETVGVAGGGGNLKGAQEHEEKGKATGDGDDELEEAVGNIVFCDVDATDGCPDPVGAGAGVALGC